MSQEEVAALNKADVFLCCSLDTNADLLKTYVCIKLMSTIHLKYTYRLQEGILDEKIFAPISAPPIWLYVWDFSLKMVAWISLCYGLLLGNQETMDDIILGLGLFTDQITSRNKKTISTITVKPCRNLSMSMYIIKAHCFELRPILHQS